MCGSVEIVLEIMLGWLGCVLEWLVRKLRFEN